MIAKLLKEINDRLARIELRLFANTIQGNEIMSALEDLTTQLNDETNAVAARIDTLTASLNTAIANGQAPSAADIAALQAVSDRLKTLGQDPAAPIPPPVAPPAAPTTPAAT